jgi:hypothetical protein
LANETLHPAVSEALIELASDYEHLAERLSSTEIVIVCPGRLRGHPVDDRPAY